MYRHMIESACVNLSSGMESSSALWIPSVSTASGTEDSMCILCAERYFNVSNPERYEMGGQGSLLHPGEVEVFEHQMSSSGDHSYHLLIGEPIEIHAQSL